MKHTLIIAVAFAASVGVGNVCAQTTVTAVPITFESFQEFDIHWGFAVWTYRSPLFRLLSSHDVFRIIRTGEAWENNRPCSAGQTYPGGFSDRGHAWAVIEVDDLYVVCGWEGTHDLANKMMEFDQSLTKKFDDQDKKETKDFTQQVKDLSTQLLGRINQIPLEVVNDSNVYESLRAKLERDFLQKFQPVSGH
jgi:hypothetical protein